MGMWDMIKTARSDELKDLRKQANAAPKRSMLDSVRAGNQAMQQASAMQQLYVNGVPGQARIDRVADTGTLVNLQPIYEFGLTVTLPGRPPYEVTHRQMVAQAVAAHYQPGATTPVRVDPTDPTQLVFG